MKEKKIVRAGENLVILSIKKGTGAGEFSN